MKASSIFLVIMLIIVWSCVILAGFMVGFRKTIKPLPRSQINPAALYHEQKILAEDSKTMQRDALQYQRSRMESLKQSVQQDTIRAERQQQKQRMADQRQVMEDLRRRQDEQRQRMKDLRRR